MDRSSSLPVLPQNTRHILNILWDRNRENAETIVFGADFEISRRDFLTLEGNGWLNDEIVNIYLKMIQIRSEQETGLPKVYAFNTFLFSNLCSRGYPSVRRWTRKVDIFAYDILLIPVHLGNHWALVMIDMKNKRV